MPDERDRERAAAWLDKRTGIWQPERNAVSALRLVGPDDLAALLDEVRADNARLREAVRALREFVKSSECDISDFAEHIPECDRCAVLAATAWVEETK